MLSPAYGHRKIRENGRFSGPMHVLITALLALCGLTCVMPFLHIAAKSVSGYTAVTSGKVLFWPVGVYWDSFAYMFQKTMILRAFFNSVFLTALGTVITTVSTVASAYPLSKPKFKGRKFFLGWFIFAMLFNGGMVPNYMMIKALGLMDSYMPPSFAQTYTGSKFAYTKNSVNAIALSTCLFRPPFFIDPLAYQDRCRLHEQIRF